MKRISFVIVILGVFFGYSSLTSAYQYETEQSIDPNESLVKKFSEHLPGEQIDLHSGDVGHYMETISIEGNGLPITLGHRFHHETGYDIDIAKVSLEVPRIEFIHMGKPDYLGLTSSWNGNDGSPVVITPYKTNIQCNSLKLTSDSNFLDANSFNDPSSQPYPQDPSSILLSGIKIKEVS